MKKLFLLIALTLLIFTTGCKSIESTTEVWETKRAIKKGSYATALIHAKEAIKNGCDDEEFLVLKEILEDYKMAKAALDRNEPGVAKLHLEDVDDFEDSGMTEAIDELMTLIEEAIFNDKISEIEVNIDKGYISSAEWHVNDLLQEDWLTETQKQKVRDIQKRIEKGKPTPKPTPKPTAASTSAPTSLPPSGGKAILSKQEATEIARKALDVPSNADVVVSTYDTYYIVSFSYTSSYGGATYEEEVGCKVDFNTGRVYDEMG